MSAEAAGDVFLGLLVLRLREELVRWPILDHLPKMHESGEVRDAGRLLHVVGHDDDCVVVAKLIHQFFDTRGCNGVEGRRGLVEQDHFRVGRQGPGDAQALLLGPVTGKLQ